MPSIRYQFGDFVLDPRGMLLGPQGEIGLRPQAFRLLLTLVSNPRRVLSHDEILDEAWGVDHLSTSSLKQTLSDVRRALGDSASNPRFVQTVPGRGYRFVAPVQVLGARNQGSLERQPHTGSQDPSNDRDGTLAVANGNIEPTPPGSGNVERRGWMIAAVLAFVLVGLAGFYIGGVRQLGPPTSRDSARASVADERSVQRRPSVQPQRIAAILGFHSRVDPGVQPDSAVALVDALAQLVASTVLGPESLEPVPITTIEAAQRRLGGVTRLRPLLTDLGNILSVDLLAVGSATLHADNSVSAQIIMFDARSGRPDAYSSIDSHSQADLPGLARRLIAELWHWDPAKHVQAAASGEHETRLSSSSTIDIKKISIRQDLKRGRMARRLRRSMARHAASAASRPAAPEIGSL